MQAWEERRKWGYPIREDWQEGRCLSPKQISELQDGAQVSVIWGGGNGPHIYTAKRQGEDVVACTPGTDDGYPGDLYRQHWGGWLELTGWRRLNLWVEWA